MDLLQQTALAYQNLINIQYKIIIAKKKTKKTLIINFSEEGYHHLVGLHKLKDLRNLKRARVRVFQDI